MLQRPTHDPRSDGWNRKRPLGAERICAKGGFRVGFSPHLRVMRVHGSSGGQSASSPGSAAPPASEDLLRAT